MSEIKSVNEFVVRFANVNGTGSWSANLLFVKVLFRMGIPVGAKNIFPSNIQGLPTWYEVRASEAGYIGTRGGVDIMVSVNPQSILRDVQCLEPGGYFIYDSTKRLTNDLLRDDVNYFGIPLTEMCQKEYEDPKLRLLFKNIIYIGALTAMLDMDFEILKNLISDQFKGKEKLIEPNINALEIGYNYAKENFNCPIGITAKHCDKVGDKILIDGNTALGLGAVYAGATVAAWYPITPSTSVIDAYKKYAQKLRIDPKTGKRNFAVVQAEDELSAIGMVLGASWNGARAFTATSGPGISLMSEFIGLGYFTETPTVLFNVQRAGPSTGMPTRTQQSDIISCAYASHGDTKHVLLFPSTPKECFDMGADAFDLAERLQTPVILMSDLDLGMNDTLSDPLEWDDNRKYDRGKVLTAKDLDNMKEKYGRYVDVDGDGIGYRTYPGTHPTKGMFFTRGSSHDPYALYTENSDIYVEGMERLDKKWQTAKKYVHAPEIKNLDDGNENAIVFFGTSLYAAEEASDKLVEDGIPLDSMRLRSFPFNDDVKEFIEKHDKLFIVEQNKDAQMRTLLINEFDINPAKLIPICCYSGQPITAQAIYDKIKVSFANKQTSPNKKEVAQ
jgi:2-oxoglutarate ferredoxin oxidoreductase subunit alpha